LSRLLRTGKVGAAYEGCAQYGEEQCCRSTIWMLKRSNAVGGPRSRDLRKAHLYDALRQSQLLDREAQLERLRKAWREQHLAEIREQVGLAYAAKVQVRNTEFL
jgi:hypothetical protein